MSTTTPLQTSWETQFAAGEPAATIHLQNYQLTVRGPQDCWGRINQPLPALVSVQVAKSTPFADSAAGDSVRPDTVHYGKLSKYLQSLFDGLETVPEGRRLADLAGVLCERLAGLQVREGVVVKELQPFLERSSFKYLKVTVHLPKSSLLGNGVSLTAAVSMNDNGVPQARSLTLRIHDLRVPVLIGVNEHEKKTKQIMLVNVEVDKWVTREDEYRQLEAVVTKVSAANHTKPPYVSIILLY